MAQGIIQGIAFVLDSSSPKMCGKEDAKEVAPWTAPKWIFPMQELSQLVSRAEGRKMFSYLSLKPKTAFATL